MTFSPLVQVSPLDDPERLAAVARTGLMDTPAESCFDRLTRLAARLLAAPAALFTIVDHERAFAKSAEGLADRWRGRNLPSLAHAFAPDVVRTGAPLIIGDARATPPLAGHLAIRDLGLAAYAGVPVAAPGGHLIGALSVADCDPRRWRDDDVAWLEELAELARTELELRDVTTRDPLAGLVTCEQFETALAGRLVAAELNGEPCSLIRLALRPRPGHTAILPTAREMMRCVRDVFADQGTVARTDDGGLMLLPEAALEQPLARRRSLELARRLMAEARASRAATAPFRMYAGIATSRAGARVSPAGLMAAARCALRPLTPRRATPLR